MTANWDAAFAWLIGNEGRYTDNQADGGNWTGGKIGVGKLVGTCWGISAPLLAAHLRRDPSEDEMRNLSQDTAKAIAKPEFWDRYQLDRFPLEIAFQVFDAAYNGGHPALWLQHAAGVTPDGQIGDATVAAVLTQDPDKVVMRFDAARLEYMADLPNWNTFGRGWAKRIAQNLRRAAT